MQVGNGDDLLLDLTPRQKLPMRLFSGGDAIQNGPTARLGRPRA